MRAAIWAAMWPSAAAYLLIALPHSGSTSLMQALAALLPRPACTQSRNLLFQANVTGAEASFWRGWPYSDSGTLTAAQFRALASPVGKRNFHGMVNKQHILPLDSNLEALSEAAADFARGGVFLFRSVWNATDSYCRRFRATEGQVAREYRQLSAFTSRWQALIARLEQSHSLVTIMFEALTEDPAREILRVVKQWELDAVFEQARGFFNATNVHPKWIWQMDLIHNRSSVLAQVSSMQLAEARKATYSTKVVARCATYVDAAAKAFPVGGLGSILIK